MSVNVLKLNRSVVAILAGYAIEKYDMFLYGFFTILMGELFFPPHLTTNNKSLSIILSLGIFASGYILRPLGGIYFGHLGDKLGRKKALLMSLGLASFFPLLLSVLPVYNTIGIFAPICLIICRLLQGFCSGGEFSGASVFLQEQSSENNVAFLVSLLRSVGFFGVALGTIVAYISTLPTMPHWGWRIPFFVGWVLTIVFYFIRLKYMLESKVFQKIEKNHKIKRFPLIGLLKNSKDRLAGGIGLTIFASTSFYMSTIYTGSILKISFNLPNYKIIAINMGIALFSAIIIPFLGLWADKLKISNFLTKSILCNIILIYPLFWLMEKYFYLPNFIIFQIIFGTLCASFYAPFAGLLPKIFSAEERYSGVAFSITFVQAILGGLTPFISALLVYMTGDKKAPAYLLIVGALIALISMIKLKVILPYSNLIESIFPTRKFARILASIKEFR
ncbi:MAG: MFS transporter [Candidatus Paracaedimonas acanthamoebae]|uniref:MFS transporter n=1 Tax=Candidatus Paracaedimonas acanthamoebae TaxID=244581 RepID=A0A8J7PJP1_9PROT|nr:MFS transporter [Candidatus Paracaedimonas acanthamoebae]